jgi:hypothetical protein
MRRFAVVMIVAGLTVLGWGAIELKRAHVSSTWPSTTATVIRASVREQDQRQENETGASYYPTIQYAYSALGEHFIGERIAFGGVAAGSLSQARQILDQYPTGKLVTVYYDPNDPSAAVLKAGYRLPAYLAAAVGLVFLAGGLIAWRSWRRKQNRRNIYLGR